MQVEKNNVNKEIWNRLSLMQSIKVKKKSVWRDCITFVFFFLRNGKNMPLPYKTYIHTLTQLFRRHIKY